MEKFPLEILTAPLTCEGVSNIPQTIVHSYSLCGYNFLITSSASVIQQNNLYYCKGNKKRFNRSYHEGDKLLQIIPIHFLWTSHLTGWL